MTKQSETRDLVLDLIEQLEVGEAIPSERGLSADLGVSRPRFAPRSTTSRARGTSSAGAAQATFVGEPKIAQELTMTSFTDDGGEGGSARRAELELDLTLAGARLGRLLHVSPSEPVVIASRLRLADGESMAIETVHVRETHIPGLTAGDLEEKSFYELLRDRYGIVVVGGTQTIEPTVTDEDESAASAFRSIRPHFASSGSAHADTGEIVEFVESIYRG